MEELARLLVRKWGFQSGPMGSDTYWLTIEWYYSFEPHGRASETWEEVWEVTLNGIRAHWKHLRDGWVPCRTDNSARFTGRTLAMAIARAKAFLEEAKPEADGALLR